jgi:hypothetical protein
MRRNVIGAVASKAGWAIARGREVLSRDVFVIRLGRPKDEGTPRDKRLSNREALAVACLAILILVIIIAAFFSCEAYPRGSEMAAGGHMKQAVTEVFIESVDSDTTFPDAYRAVLNKAGADLFRCRLCGEQFRLNPSPEESDDFWWQGDHVILYCPSVHEIVDGPRLLVAKTDGSVHWIPAEDAPPWLQEEIVADTEPQP